jgi:catechol 2,3-dioxygenase-like lactoylglutathione lyase family enzyme
MIDGVHIIVYSADAEADRAFFRDILGFPHVDAGDGWLIFALPPSEAAIHPGDVGDGIQMFLMCGDIDAEVSRLNAAGVVTMPLVDRGWGRVTMLTLPGGGQLGLYQPRHPRATTGCGW